MTFRVTQLGGFGGGGQNFPVVQATNTSFESATTTPTISLPSGIVAGDLLIIALDIGGSKTVTDWDVTKDFTEIVQDTETTRATLAVAYRIADGTEGATVDVTINSADTSSHVSYRISGAGGSAPEGTIAKASSGSADPPSLTPSWGLRKTLWLAMKASKNNASSVDPSNYTDGIGTNSGSEDEIRSAVRELEAASEDPGVFTMDSEAWVAATIAIEPL